MFRHFVKLFGLVICCYCGLLADAALAAPSIDNITTGQGNSSTTLTISHATSGANRLMLVAVHMRPEDDTGSGGNRELVDSVTYNGIALTLLAAINLQDDVRTEVWRLTAPPTGTHDVVITFDEVIQTGYIAGVTTFTGVHQTSPHGAAVVDSGNDSRPASITVPSVTDALVFAAVSAEVGNRTTLLTPDGGQNVLWNLNQQEAGGNTHGDGDAAAGTKAGAASVSFSWGMPQSDDWAVVGLSINDVTVTPPAASSCGNFLGNFPIFTGTKLEIEDDVEVNGNSVNDGTTGAGSALNTDGSISIENPTLPELDPSSFPANGSSTDVDLGFFQALSSPAPDEIFRDEVTVEEDATAFFLGEGTFHIDKLKIEKDATLQMEAGIYFIDELKIEKDAKISILSSPVIIHIGDKFESEKDVDINKNGSVTALQILLHEDAELKLEKDNDFTGIIYGPEAKKVEVEKDTKIHGVIVTDGEVKIEKDVEITLTPADIAAINNTSTCAVSTSVGHYAISYPLGNPGVTCEALAVRITAHEVAPSHTSMVPTTGTVLTLTSGGGIASIALKQGLNPSSFSNLGGGSAQYTFDGTEEFVEFWLTQTNPTSSPHVDIDVSDGSATDIDGDATEDVNAQFQDAVFRFFAGGVGESIGTQIAAKESSAAPGSQVIQLRSVRTNTTTGACEAGLTDGQTIEMAFECTNPSTCQAGQRVQINNVSNITPGNAGGSTIDESNGNFSPVSLDFGSTGTATFSFDYDDAGQIGLHARELIVGTSPDPNFILFGSSNLFVVKPAGFCIETTTANNACVSADPTDLACTAFVKAGTSAFAESQFSLDITAVTFETAGDTDFCAGSNVVTPNFQLNNIPLTANKLAPAGGVNGSLDVNGVSIGVGDLGTQNIPDQAIDEVGVFSISATVAAPTLTYLGEDIGVSTSQNIGRFIPDRFTVTDNTPAFADECVAGSFTYLEQPFYYPLASAPALTVTALNTNGDVTENYDGGNFWKLGSTLANRNYTDNATASATFSFDKDGGVTLTGDTDFTGAATLTLDNGTAGDEFMYDRGAEETPFSADVDLVFSVADLTDSDNVCLDADNDNTCESYTISSLAGANLRFGRLTVGTAFGSELLPLSVPMQTEFFDGAGFILNTEDSCTSLLATDLSLTSSEETQTDGDVVVAAGGSCPATGCSTASIANTPLLAGDAGLGFSAPGTGFTGDIDITLDLSAGGSLDLPWLQYDWDNDGNNDDDPIGRASFGLYSGNSEYIYTREPWN